MLDRWRITITDQKTEEESSKGSKDNLNEEKRKMVSENIPFNIINNYFSIGVVSNDIALFPFKFCIFMGASPSESSLSFVSFRTLPFAQSSTRNGKRIRKSSTTV